MNLAELLDYDGGNDESGLIDGIEDEGCLVAVNYWSSFALRALLHLVGECIAYVKL